MGKIYIIADTHNFHSLPNAFKKLDSLISLGDIAGVDFQKYSSRQSDYSTAWKMYSPQTHSELTNWFQEINVSGWKKQMANICAYSRRFTVLRGNTDLYMLERFSEIRSLLNETLQELTLFKFLSNPYLEEIGNVQIIYLPYSHNQWELEGCLKQINIGKKLFVLGHCPAYKNHKKDSYVRHYRALEEIKCHFNNSPFTYIHGHVHADKTYKYKMAELPNITIVTPRAEDSLRGISSVNDYLQLDTNTAELVSFSVDTKKETGFDMLPLKYFNTNDHWNSFVIS